MAPPEVEAKKSEEPILIVDRAGLIGERLAIKVKDEAPTVLVSEKIAKHEDIIHVPYDKKFPQIPDNAYSHIFVIDDGSKATREALSSFLEKAENDNSIFLFATDMREINEKLIGDLTGYYQKAKIVFFGDVFGAPSALNKSSYVNKFIAQARLKNKILVPEESTAVSYPIYFDDLIDGLLEVVFGQDLNTRVFYAFPKYPPTLLTLARMIQKSNPHVTLDFTKEKVDELFNIPEDGRYILGEKYPLEERIKKLEIAERPFIERDEEIQEEVAEKNFPSLPKWGIFGILILALLPVISTLFFSFLGNVSSKSLEFYLDRGDLDNAQKSSFFAKTYFDLAKKTGSMIPFLLLGFDGNHNRATGASFVIDGLVSYDFSKVQQGITYLQKEKTDFPMLGFTSSTINIWEDLLGFKNKRKYLLLILDKNQIRPTGGIIDSYALLTIDKGKSLVSEIKDAEGPDSKSRGIVEPSFPIRRYLGSNNLEFKDTGFDIDFPKSASNSALLLSVLEGEVVDGVIALDKSLFLKIEEELEKESSSYITLLRTIEEAINRKEILFAFNDSNIQNIFTANSWSSSLWDTRVEEETVVNDFLGVVEANLGNKINANVSRTVSQNVNLAEDGTVSAEVKINYKNNAKEVYKNYLKIVLPLGSEILEVRLNERAMDTISPIKNPAVYEDEDFESPEELELDQTSENGKTIYGVYLEIGAGAAEEVSISYVYPKEIDLNTHLSYNNKVFKQPYLESIYKFSISYPQSFKVTKGSAKFEKELKGDETILVELSRI